MLNLFRTMRPNSAPLSAVRIPAAKSHAPVQLIVARESIFGCQTAATAPNTQNGTILARRRSICEMRPGAVPRSTPENQHAGGAVAHADRPRPKFGCGWQIQPAFGGAARAVPTRPKSLPKIAPAARCTIHTRKPRGMPLPGQIPRNPGALPICHINNCGWCPGAALVYLGQSAWREPSHSRMKRKIKLTPR
jgi:hypothetical protein